MPFQHTGHKIKLNHSNALPNYILSLWVESEGEAIDVSGNRFERRFKAASVSSGRLRDRKVTGRKTEHFTDCDSLWSYIFGFTRGNYTTWLVGHSVLPHLIYAGLPLRFSRGEISIDKPRSKRTREDNDEENPHAQALAVIESPPTIIGCRVGATQGRIVIVDYANWFPGELPTESLPAETATTDSDLEGNTDDGIRSRSNRKAEFIHRSFESLIKWVGDNEMGMFRYTASAQAIGAYRHRFMERQIYVHDNSAVSQLERTAYYGGRSECFYIGNIDETVYQLDVNALFPAVMREHSYPYMLHRYENREQLLELQPSIDWSASVAEVQIHTDKPLYPLRTDTHVIFPVGTFRTVLAGCELYRAAREGIIQKVGSWAEYKMGSLFTKFVDELWAMRQRYKEQGNVEYEKFTKRIMNSLYGKFAQLTPSWVNVPTNWSMLPFTKESRLDSKTGHWTTFRSIGWQCQRLAERTIKPGSFYAIAAMVTANARSRMDHVRRVCGSRNCLYQGVDSIVATERGLSNLRESNLVANGALGRLRIEHSCNYGVIRGISDYQLGSKVVLSSRSLNSEVTDLGEIRQHKYYVMDHLFKNGPVDYIEERVEEWQRRNGYNKGHVQPDGWVLPFELGTKATSASDGSKPSFSATDAN